MSESVDQVEVPFMNRVPTFDFHDAETVHDRVVLVEGMNFYVQSGLLSVWSEFFRTLFNSEFKEKNESEIKLEDISADGFKIFMQVIYPGYFEVRAEHLESLIKLSHRFLAPYVLEVCTRFIDKEFDQIDKIMLYKVADIHEMKSLKKKAMDFITNNIETLNLVQLLKLAFEHDLTELKAEVRSVIHCGERELRYKKCPECPVRIKRLDCGHKAENISLLSRNSLIAEHINEIIKLPVEIQSFVLVSSVKAD